LKLVRITDKQFKEARSSDGIDALLDASFNQEHEAVQRSF